MQILTLHNTRGNLNFALHLVTIETLVNYLVEILIREDLYFNDIVYLYFFFSWSIISTRKVDTFHDFIV